MEPQSPRSLLALRENSNVSTPVKERLEARIKQNGLDAEKVRAKEDEAAQRRKTQLLLKQKLAADHVQHSAKKKERQVLLVKERTDNLKRQTTEKQKKANALVQAETERKMAIARKMAGGEKQGKLAREQLVQEREEQRLAELEQKLHLQNMQAAARAEAIKQDKIKSAKKTLSKQEAGKERAALLLEQKQNETLKSLGDRQERATLKAENEAHTKKMKAQAELEKVKSAKKNKSKEQSSFIQDSPSADFFNSPHDTKSITTSNIQNKSSSIDSTESTESITPMPRIIDLLHVDNRTVSSHEEEEDDDQKDSDDHPNNLLRSKEDTRCFFFC